MSLTEARGPFSFAPYFLTENALIGKSVLCTGASGSFGNAFVRRALADGARRVVVYSRGEAKQAEMKAALPDNRLRFLIGDVRDANRILDACRGVDIVIHSAALKRVDACELDPNEAVATNITGTQNVARACIANRVSRAVFLSTDKVVEACTLYGMTKAAAERVWLNSNVYAAGTGTVFGAVRYGNVLGSTGSVLPIWIAQAKASGTITVTDPEMTRFWMRMGDAVNLVVLALETMRGGDVLIPKIGASSIGALAQAVVPDAEMRIVGAGPGEKRYERLVSSNEAHNVYDAGNRFILEPDTRSWDDLPRLAFPKVEVGFSYSSHTAPRISIMKLREMIA